MQFPIVRYPECKAQLIASLVDALSHSLQVPVQVCYPVFLLLNVTDLLTKALEET